MEKLKLLLQMVKLHMKNYNIVFVKLFNNISASLNVCFHLN